MEGPDNDHQRDVDAAIRRILAAATRRERTSDPTTAACERATHEALDHVRDPDVAADMRAVEVPMDGLLAAAGLADPPADEDEPEPPLTWWEAIRRRLWSPQIAYAVAACLLLVVVGRELVPPGPPPPQRVALDLAGDAARGEGEPAGVVVLEAEAEQVDLQVDRPVDPTRPIRYRAILQEVAGEALVNVAFSADNRRFAPAPAGMAFPVYRVPAHLLRAGRAYRLVFEPVTTAGEVLADQRMVAEFRVAE